MKTFKYKAKASDGSTVTGVIEAYDEFEAVDEIRRTCPIVEFVKPLKEERRINIDLNEPLWVSAKTLSLTANQFYIMLKSGLSMTRVIEIVAEQCDDKLMKRILKACAADVASGYSLANSLEKNGKKIPAVFIETIRAGEESGTLERSFKSLEVYYSRAYKTRKKVKSAMTYPIIVLLLAIVVIAIVMIKLVPVMIDTLQGFGTDLPTVTKVLIAISDFFVKYWYILLIVVAVLFIGLFAFGRTDKGKLIYSKIKMKLPVIGKITKFNTAAQVANTLATLVEAGLPITHCIEIVAKVLDTRCVGEEMGKMVADLESGISLGEALKKSKYLPEMLMEMVEVGEQSGSLEETLQTIGLYYNEEASAASDQALKLIEPMITVILGVVVGFIVIAIYVPMFSMSSGAGGLQY